MKNVRVRFAPSPTGPLHIGGVRTALFNYLFAKANKGTFILRIEDTDQTRYVEGAEDYIINSLEWCGMKTDEGPVSGGSYGPYRQSERKAIYNDFSEQLVKVGKAYYAFDTPSDLEVMKERLKAKGIHTPKYDGATRMQMKNSLTLSDSETKELLEKNTPYVVRLLVPQNETVTFSDIIRGEVSFQTNELDDKVLFKSDGMPTYHMANVIDDYSMKISHVIRGEEWLSSTAHHVLLYQAFGWTEEMPEFVHLPLILKSTGKGKLSKRDGAKFGFPVFPMAWSGQDEDVPGFDTFGFDPKAVINFLAMLGWSPGDDREMFSLGELVQVFSLDHIHKGGARFDFEKAKWFNQQYLMQTSDMELSKIVAELAQKRGVDTSGADLEAVCAALKTRVNFYQDFLTEGDYFFGDVKAYDEKTIRKKWKDNSRNIIENVSQLISELDDFKADSLAEIVKGYINDNELSFGAVFPFLRIALSGSTQGPDLFEMMAILGKDKVIGRLSAGMEVFDDIVRQKNAQNG